MNNYTFDTRAAVIEEIANWYSEKGWRMDEEDVADAIRALATAPSPASLPVAPEAAMLVKELNRISMSLAADLVQGTDYTFHGQDYLDRDFVCERVMRWRAEWDATAPARNALAEAARSAVAPSDAKDATVPDHSEREAANAGGRTERDGWEAAVKALTERAAGHDRMANYDQHDECMQCVAMLNDMKPATIAAGQEAANAKDVARLDWLIQEEACVQCERLPGSGRKVFQVVWPENEDYSMTFYETPREAIDAQMSIDADNAAMIAAPSSAAGQEGGK